MIDRRYFRYFDWISFTLMLCLIGIGLLFVFSATYTPEKPFSLFFKKEVFGIVSGLGLYVFFCHKDMRSITQWGYYGFFITLLLLCYTIFAGWVGMGAKRWISLYIIRFQPSELIKLSLPFFLSVYLSNNKELQTNTTTPRFHNFLYPLFFLSLAFVLVLRQPDLGTALLILFSGLATLWLAGLKRSFFMIMLASSILCAPILWKGMKPYQQKRVLTLLGYGSKNNERYQVEQSKIAIGSGGLLGKGLLKGTQNKLGFLPEDHTDFIFSVICEEWGLAGALLVLFLFSFLFVRLLLLAFSMPLFEFLLAFALTVPLIFSTIINIGMVIGILPIVGIPLPFITYGITHLWVSMISLGILNNLAIRRHYY